MNEAQRNRDSQSGLRGRIVRGLGIMYDLYIKGQYRAIGGSSKNRSETCILEHS